MAPRPGFARLLSLGAAWVALVDAAPLEADAAPLEVATAPVKLCAAGAGCEKELDVISADMVSLLQYQISGIAAEATASRLAERPSSSTRSEERVGMGLAQWTSAYLSQDGVPAAGAVAVATGAAQGEALTWLWISAVVTLLVTVPVIVRLLGGLPPVQEASAEKATTPPALVTCFTGIVCVGVMANVTVVIPVVEVAAGSVVLSGYIIASYTLGALVGLCAFWHLSVRSLRTAYLLHACCMVVGNLVYTVAGMSGTAWGLIFGRAITGLEAGVMYNTALAIVHLARGANKTRYLVLYQFFVALGIILGPVLSSASVMLSAALGASKSVESVCANSVMSVWGALVGIALLSFFPADIAELEREAGVPAAEAAPAPAAGLLAAGEGGAAETKSVALGLASFNASLVRMVQRLLWESGAVLVFTHGFGWRTRTASLAFALIAACQACTQLAFSGFLSGALSDGTVMTALELGQVVGILLMFDFSSSDGTASQATFLVGSVIAYSSNAVWAGVCNSFCVKRAIPGSIFCVENLLLLNQVAIFLGIAFGGVISRSIPMSAYNMEYQNILALLMLAGAIMQLFFDALVVTNMSWETLVLIGSVVTGFALALGVLVTQVGGTGVANVFSWHIFCMGLAWPCLAFCGFWAYRLDDSWRLTEKNQRRNVHLIFMAGAAVLSAAGYYFIWAAHHSNGEGQFGGLYFDKGVPWLSRGAARFVHVVLGYLVLAGTAVQAPAGLWKRHALLSEGVRSFTWHGTFGKLLLLGGLGASLIGVWIEWNNAGGWSLPVKIALTAALVALIVAVTGSRAPPEQKA